MFLTAHLSASYVSYPMRRKHSCKISREGRVKDR
jgi:hypothetical protein